MALVNIVACGETANLWDGSGDSIGVNDAFKFGHQIQRLVLLNGPHEFEHERFKTIKRTNADFVYTCIRDWGNILGNVTVFNYSFWKGSIEIGKFQTSRTSPFCAISIAYNLGYDEIVLWGVDFKSHPNWNKENPNYYQEIQNYKDLAKQLWNRGVKVYSAMPGVLDLPVYEKQLC